MGRKPGTKITYNPRQTARYRSQWLRLQRSVEIIQILQQGGSTYYHCKSGRSSMGYWDVEYRPDKDRDSSAYLPPCGSGTSGSGGTSGSSQLPACPAPGTAIIVTWGGYFYWSEPPEYVSSGGYYASLNGYSFADTLETGEVQYAYYMDWQDEPRLYQYRLSVSHIVSASAPLPPLPANLYHSPYALVEVKGPNGQTLYSNPSNADPNAQYCGSGGSGGGGSTNPCDPDLNAAKYGPWDKDGYRCNCPDYRRKQSATGKFLSEMVSRDWSASNAGSGIVAGTQQPCKHMLEVKQLRGEPVDAKPNDWAEMLDWKAYNRKIGRQRARTRAQKRKVAIDRIRRARRSLAARDRMIDRMGRVRRQRRLYQQSKLTPAQRQRQRMINRDVNQYSEPDDHRYL